MAALVITAADIGIGAGARVQEVEAGAAISHGQTLYRNTANNDNRLANAGAEATSLVTGISIVSAVADGDAVLIIADGTLILGNILTQGTEYYLGATDGTIVPRADLVTGNWVTRLGIASSATELELDIQATRIQVP